MAFTDIQVRQLKAKLDPRSTSRRAKPTAPTSVMSRDGTSIAEANRIFGFDAWDRRTLVSRLRVERRERSTLCRGLYRQGAGQRAGRRNKDCSGRFWYGRGQSPYPGASA